MLGEGEGGAVDDLDVGSAVGEGERRLQGLGQPLLHPLLAHQPVDHDLDGVLVVSIELDLLGELSHLAIDPGPGEALLGQVGEEPLVLPLSPPDHRRQHLEPGPLRELEDAIDDLLWGLPLHRGAVVGTVGDSDPGVEETEIVVDLGDGAHRRPRVARCCLLVDRDRRRQPVDEVHVGLVHLPQELAGVGRERFHVAALPFGVDGVEGQG
jgi:hypothetical protein